MSLVPGDNLVILTSHIEATETWQTSQQILL